MPHYRRNEPDYGRREFSRYPRSEHYRDEPRRGDESRRARTDEMVSGGGVSFQTDFERLGWGEEPYGEQYYGTGSHYGGGFATAPSTRASGAGIYGAPGYAGQGAWSDRYTDYRGDYGEHDYRGSDYRGRGPKGYQRSDQRLQEMICDRLTDDPRIDASDIGVEVRDHIVRLTGSVDDRRTKYEVEELVERCGAKEIDNQLRVQSNSSR
jgi:hypothetical protein